MKGVIKSFLAFLLLTLCSSVSAQVVSSITPPASQADLTALQNQIATAPQYVSGFTTNTPGSLSALYTTAPCNSARSNYYAVVSDLYGVLTETLRCTYFGSWGYGWRATIPFYAVTLTTNGGTINISCNTTAPVIRITGAAGSLTSSLNVVFNSTNCTPGQRQEIQMDLALGVYSATASSLIGTSATKVLGSSGTSLFVFDAAGWRAY